MNKEVYSRTKNSNDSWETPRYFFEFLQKEMKKEFGDSFEFTIDLASSKENALCKRYYTEEDNALEQNWKNEIGFLNPPFSKAKEFIEKAYLESQFENTIIVMIIPSRTDTAYWHDYIMKSYKILFCKGRVDFFIPCYNCNKRTSKPILIRKMKIRVCRKCYNLLMKEDKIGSGSTFPLVVIIFKKHDNPITTLGESLDHKKFKPENQEVIIVE